MVQICERPQKTDCQRTLLGTTVIIGQHLSKDLSKDFVNIWVKILSAVFFISTIGQIIRWNGFEKETNALKKVAKNFAQTIVSISSPKLFILMCKSNRLSFTLRLTLKVRTKQQMLS